VSLDEGEFLSLFLEMKSIPARTCHPEPTVRELAEWEAAEPLTDRERALAGQVLGLDLSEPGQVVRQTVRTGLNTLEWAELFRTFTSGLCLVGPALDATRESLEHLEEALRTHDDDDDLTRDVNGNLVDFGWGADAMRWTPDDDQPEVKPWLA